MAKPDADDSNASSAPIRGRRRKLPSSNSTGSGDQKRPTLNRDQIADGPYVQSAAAVDAGPRFYDTRSRFRRDNPTYPFAAPDTPEAPFLDIESVTDASKVVYPVEIAAPGQLHTFRRIDTADALQPYIARRDQRAIDKLNKQPRQINSQPELQTGNLVTESQQQASPVTASVDDGQSMYISCDDATSTAATTTELRTVRTRYERRLDVRSGFLWVQRYYHALEVRVDNFMPNDEDERVTVLRETAKEDLRDFATRFKAGVAGLGLLAMEEVYEEDGGASLDEDGVVVEEWLQAASAAGDEEGSE